jgi:PAS domain S-box-containing protein
MAKRHVDLGYPPLDAHLSGLSAGEAFLLFHTRIEVWNALVGHIARASVRDHHRLCFATFRKELPAELGAVSRPLVWMPDEGAGKKGRLSSSIEKFVRNIPSGSILILDDLAPIARMMPSKLSLQKFVSGLASTIQKKGSILVGSLDRSALSLEMSILLKDSVDICLEAFVHEKELYFYTLLSRNRMLGGGAPPLKIPLHSFLRAVSASPATDEKPAPLDAGISPDVHGFMTGSLYAELFQRSPEPMAIVGTTGDVREFNDRSLSLLGYSREELRTVALLDIVSPPSRRTALRLIIEMRRRQRSRAELVMISKSGKQLPVDVSVSSTGMGFFVLLLRDNTERSRLEQSLAAQCDEAKLQFERSSRFILIVREGKSVYCGESLAQLLAFENPGAVLNASWRTHFEPESARRCQKAFGDALEGRETILDATGKAADGGRRSLKLHIIATRYQGKPAIQISVQDVTTLDSLVTRLTASEATYRTLIDSVQEPASIMLEDRFLYLNEACVSCYGFESRGELEKLEFPHRIKESGRESFALLAKKVASGRVAAQTMRTTGMRKDGSEFDVELTLRSPGEIVPGGIIVFHRDITEQIFREKELNRLRTEFAQLDDLTLTLTYSTGQEKLHEQLLQKALQLLKLEIGGLYLPSAKGKMLELRNSHNVPHAVSAKLGELSLEEGLGGLVAKMLSPHFYGVDQYPSYLPHKVLFREQHFAAVCLIPLTHGGRLEGLLLLASRKIAPVPGQEFLAAIGAIAGMVVANVGEYKRVARAENDFRTLAEKVQDTVYRSSADGRMLYVSPRIELLTGYRPKDFYSNKSLWLSLVHPDDKKVLLQRITEGPQSGTGVATEYRFLPKGKATYRWVRDAVTFLKNDDGVIDGMTGILTDVSETKELLQELRGSNVLRGSILSSMQEGVLVTDRSFRVLEWNGVMEEITGLRRLDVIGKSIEAVFPPEGQANFQKLLRRALEGEYVRSEEFRPVLPSSGKEIFLWGSFSPLKNDSGSTEGVVGVVSDISERKQLERDLRESEQVLRNVIDTMSDILLITDLKGRVLQVNRTFLQNLGYARQECVGQEFPYPWVLEEEMGRFVLWIANLREKNWLHDFDMTWKTKEDDLISMSLSTTLLRNSYGEPIAMLNIARDITERRRLMKELQRRNRQVELINRIISAANQTMDFNEIFMKIAAEIRETVPCDDMNIALLNPAGKSLLVLAALLPDSRYGGDQVPIERTASQYAVVSQQPVIIPDLAAEASYEALYSFQEGMRSEMSLPIVVKGKVLGTFNLLSYEPHTYHDEHASTLVPVAQQIGVIIDRVRLFRQVSEDATYIHKLLDSIDSVVYTVDTGCQIREVNKAWHDFVRTCGVTDDLEYHGMNLMDAVPSEPLKILLQNVVGDLLAGRIRFFSQEFAQSTPGGERMYQLTINPMVIESRVIGLVISHTDITALKQTEHELKRSYEQLLALNEISTLISTSLNLEDILHGTIPLLNRTFEASGVLVYLREKEGEGLTLAQKEGLPDITTEQIRHLPESESVTGLAISTKEPLYLTDNAVDDSRILQANRPLLRRAGVVSMAAIPLMSKDKVHGALDIFYNARQEFPSQLRQMLTLIGNQLGAAIENALLYQELLSQIARLTVLYELSQQLTSTLDSRQIFKIIYEHVARIIHFNLVRVDLIDARRQTVTHSMSAERVAGEFAETSEAGISLRIPAESPEQYVLESRAIRVNPEKTVIHLPMFSKGTIMGIMSAHTDLDNAFSGIQLRLLESIGNLAAIALEKAMFYEETVQKSQEIERRNKELDDFTYVVSHDLKEPLISIEGFGKILQLDYQEVIGKEGKEYLDSILGASTRMKGLIDDLLMLSRVSRPSEAFRVVSTKKVIGEIRTDMEFTIRQKGASLIIPEDLPLVVGNETHVKVVFQNLIGNAFKFNTGDHPEVEIRFQNAENNYYLFSVRDNGIGISPDFFEKIFIIFQRLHRREEYEGSGAGLAIVKKIIEIHRGKIWVTSEIGKGSTFFFTLPRVESES